jgi:RNA polymerase sigma factor (sigma-70 family)
VTAHPARDGTLITDLVTRARTGDKLAWDALVERYAPLIRSICGRYRLSRADAEDTGQNVWLRLAGQLDKIRDPAALPGWLATTTSRERGRIPRTAHGPHAPVHALDAGSLPDQQAGTADQELLAAERHTALRGALSRLPQDGQQLIALLIADPPVPTPKSAPGSASPSAASARTAADAWAGYAVIRPSPRSSTPPTPPDGQQEIQGPLNLLPTDR